MGQSQQHIVNNVVHEKNILKVEINKELGSDFKIQRYEDIVDDDSYYATQRRSHPGVVRINVDSNNNTAVIPERKTAVDVADLLPGLHQAQTLVIDDANHDKLGRRAVHIDGQSYVHKNEVQISEHQQRRDWERKQRTTIDEFSRKIEMIERDKANQVKVTPAEFIDTRRTHGKAVVDLDDDRRVIERSVKVTVDIKGDERPHAPPSRPVHTIVDDDTRKSTRVVYEDTVNVQNNKHKSVDDEDEMFDEWTEVG